MLLDKLGQVDLESGLDWLLLVLANLDVGPIADLYYIGLASCLLFFVEGALPDHHSDLGLVIDAGVVGWLRHYLGI